MVYDVCNAYYIFLTGFYQEGHLLHLKGMHSVFLGETLHVKKTFIYTFKSQFFVKLCFNFKAQKHNPREHRFPDVETLKIAHLIHK